MFSLLALLRNAIMILWFEGYKSDLRTKLQAPVMSSMRLFKDSQAKGCHMIKTGGKGNLPHENNTKKT